MTEIDVLVAGDAAITFSWQLSAPPVPGRTSKILSEAEPEGRFGGCAPSIALTLSTLGHRVGLVSWLGDDAYGGAYLAELKRHGVDTAGVEVAAGQPSARALMLYDPSGAATCLHHPSGSGSLRLPDAAQAMLRRANWLALTAGPAPMSEALLDSRLPQTRVAWDVKGDPRHYPEQLRRRILHEADLICFNREEVAFLAEALDQTAAGSNEAQVQLVRNATEATLVLTEGPAGSRVIDRDGGVAIAAAPVRAVDPTGVGDAFFAALLSGIIRGQSPRAAAEFATSAAADYLLNRERSA